MGYSVASLASRCCDRKNVSDIAKCPTRLSSVETLDIGDTGTTQNQRKIQELNVYIKVILTSARLSRI